MCLTSKLQLKHSEPDLNTLNSDLHTNYAAKFQEIKGRQAFS